MPLNQGKSEKAVSENISTLIREGKPRKVAIATAKSIQRRAKMPVHTSTERKKKGITRGKGGKIKKARKKKRNVLKGATFE